MAEDKKPPRESGPNRANRPPRDGHISINSEQPRTPWASTRPVVKPGPGTGKPPKPKP